MLPVAICFGEVFTFEGYDVTGFLDNDRLHTLSYISCNLFAGEGWLLLCVSLFPTLGATRSNAEIAVNA